jgi:hypothetical protein
LSEVNGRNVFITAVLLAVGCPANLSGQGFTGKLWGKTTVVLERKLPAALTLPGKSFSVKASATRPTDPCQKLAADELQSTVETALIRYNSELQLDPVKPDTVISVRVLSCTAVAKPETSVALTGKNKGKQEPSGVKVSASLTVAYQAKSRTGASVDAENIDVKYAHEFNNTMAAISETKKIVSKIPLPGRKHHQEVDSDDPQTVEDVIQIVVTRMTQRIAARMVNTNERVEALLARGSAYDENNRYAIAGQWTKFVEALETMPPLPDPEDDSYRLYNIGVGDEALGYKAETPASAKRYFEQAVVQYRKAGESNPHEKYFIEPVNRIEVALEHYKKLSAAAPAPAKAATKAKTK